MKIRAPAKINLTLRVLGKRADGYHLLDTIMAPVSLYDDIEIRKASPAGKRRPGNSAYKSVAIIPMCRPAKRTLSTRRRR